MSFCHIFGMSVVWLTLISFGFTWHAHRTQVDAAGVTEWTVKSYMTTDIDFCI